MPMKDGTGPNGKGPKNKNKGVPTPKLHRGKSRAQKGQCRNPGRQRR